MRQINVLKELAIKKNKYFDIRFDKTLNFI